jgi:signal transduction histidine kinase
VKEFGCGIPADKLDSLFINFGSLEEHRKVNPQGRGLGLSICKLIVERMGGSVGVESEEGVGSKFNLIFNADTF